MNLFIYQLKQTYLSLKQKPGFVFSVVSTMGITLGALLCVLTLAYVMLIKPLPYPDQERLYQVEQRQIDKEGQHNVSGFNYPGLVDYYQNQQAFSLAALVDYDVSSLVSHTDSPVIQSSYVTPEWFELMAAPLAKGRYLSAEEGINNYKPSAVISHQAWQTLFGGADDILGKKVSTKNNTYTIIGVLAEHFIEPALLKTGHQTQFWFPWDFNPTSEHARTIWWGRTHQRTMIGKLAQDMPLSTAMAIGSSYINEKWQFNNEHEEFYKGWHVELKLNGLKDIIIGESTYIATLLVLSSFCLVLIASMNILNLFIARLAENSHNLSIHACIGAKPSHLFKNLLLETSMLIFSSLIVASYVAALGFILLRQYLANALPRVSELQIHTFTFYCALTIGCALVVIFAWLGKKSLNLKNLNSALTSGGKGQKSQISKKLRHLLIVSQVSISLVLIFICTNVSYQAIKQITYQDGLIVENLLSLQIRMQAQNLPSQQAREVLLEQLKESLIALPEVKNVSRSTSPLTSEFNTWTLIETNSMKQVLPYGRSIDHLYLSMSGQTLIQGEYFTEQQIKDKTKNIVINGQLAKILEPNGDAIGMRLSFGTAAEEEYTYTISGIVKGLKIPGENIIPPRVYLPNSNAFNMMIELNESQSLSQEQLLKVMRETSAIFNIFKFEKLTDLKQTKLYSYYIALTVTTVVTLVSILLTLIGLYGILNYSTRIRRFEIGTRIAIGAKRNDILQLILKDNATALFTGVLSSGVILLGVYLSFNEALHQYISIGLIPVFFISIMMMSLISFIACYLPLRQYINKPAIHSLRGSD